VIFLKKSGKDYEIAMLLDFYGELLTEKQRETMDLYYNEDLSLAEIAEPLNISRQGVRDLIKKAEEELFFYEEKLGLAKKFDDAQNHAKRALELCQSGADREEIKKEVLLLLEDVG
jgi:predicted DNA-binding protein YlxM (UPF0122 family)